MRRARRAARELALNVLYQADASGVPFDEALETASEFSDMSGLESKGFDRAEEARQYGRMVATGTWAHVKEIDRYIAELAEGWPDRGPPACHLTRIPIARPSRRPAVSHSSPFEWRLCASQ